VGDFDFGVNGLNLGLEVVRKVKVPRLRIIGSKEYAIAFPDQVFALVVDLFASAQYGE
jgi:hypothetical protein